MEKIFGKRVRLLTPDGGPTSGPIDAKVIGLLFASNNDETRAFARVLADACVKLAARGKLLYIVCISLDADDAADWLCTHAMRGQFVMLPQDEAPVRNKLWAELQLTASPSLVLYDSTGSVITKNGQKVLREDAECVKYPWKPQTLDELLGEELIQRDGKEVDRRDVLAGKHVGLLFVAQGSKPSLQMIEKLYVTYLSIRQRRSGSVGASH